MQQFLIVSFMLILVSPVGQVLAGSDIPAPSSGATQKKLGPGNGTDKAREGAQGVGVVSGLDVRGSTKSAPSVSVEPGVGIDGYGRSVSPSRRRLPDPRSER
jgi:hypothetical protein